MLLKGVQLYPRWANIYILAIMPLVLQIPMVLEWLRGLM